MPRLQALFFDVGDTLVFDNPPLPLRFAQAARAAGYAVGEAQLPSAWRQAEQVGLSAYLGGLETDDADVQRRSAAAALQALGYPAPTDAQWLDLGRTFASVSFVRCVPPEALALLDNLCGRGVRLGIISDWEATLPLVLDELGLSAYFETRSISVCVGYRKPDARLFQHALGQMNVSPTDALHVGDWLELDVQGARDAGMPALLFDHARRAPQADCPRAETFAALAAYLEAVTTFS